MESLIYPTGRMPKPERFDEQQIEQWIRALEVLPRYLDLAIENKDAVWYSGTYRPGSWTRQQVIHHIADSHINAYIRTKLALTEEVPVIKPYDENAWAPLADVDAVPVNVSITLLHALHRRWTALLRSLPEEAWKRSVFHPEHNREIPVWEMISMYAWHGRHHVAQIAPEFGTVDSSPGS